LKHIASGAIAIAGSFCSLQDIDFSWKRHSEHMDFAAEKKRATFPTAHFPTIFFPTNLRQPFGGEAWHHAFYQPF
jgi:hypothetical protein